MLGQLREIDRLFEEASRSDRLGPIPLVYRLAVLHRLRQILKDRCEIDQTTAISDEVYERAVRLFQRMQFEIEVDRSERIERQTALFNMLEFVTYLSGRPYQPIEGMSSLLPMDPFREGDWFVLGQDIKRVRMTESMARWEFDCRAEECPETVLIELTGNSAARICLSKDRNWRVWSSEYAKLILLLLQNPEIPRVELERRVVGTDGGDPSSRFRQAKSRVKKELAKLTGKESLEVFAGDRLTNEVPILGLVLGPSLR